MIIDERTSQLPEILYNGLKFKFGRLESLPEQPQETIWYAEKTFGGDTWMWADNAERQPDEEKSKKLAAAGIRQSAKRLALEQLQITKDQYYEAIVRHEMVDRLVVKLLNE